MITLSSLSHSIDHPLLRLPLSTAITVLAGITSAATSQPTLNFFHFGTMLQDVFTDPNPLRLSPTGNSLSGSVTCYSFSSLHFSTLYPIVHDFRLDCQDLLNYFPGSPRSSSFFADGLEDTFESLYSISISISPCGGAVTPAAFRLFASRISFTCSGV